MSGPYETQRQAAEAVRHIIDSPAEAWRDGSHRLLEDARRTAGVQFGAYDHRILLWLAGWEPWVCAVVAGLITRAHQSALTETRMATVLDALDMAAEYKRDRAATCLDCEVHPAGLCGTCEYRLAAADEYEALAETLRGQR